MNEIPVGTISCGWELLKHYSNHNLWVKLSNKNIKQCLPKNLMPKDELINNIRCGFVKKENAESIIEALEKQTPMKPHKKYAVDNYYHACGRCGALIAESWHLKNGLYKHIPYCYLCGQRIDWSALDG